MTLMIIDDYKKLDLMSYTKIDIILEIVGDDYTPVKMRPILALIEEYYVIQNGSKIPGEFVDKILKSEFVSLDQRDQGKIDTVIFRIGENIWQFKREELHPEFPVSDWFNRNRSMLLGKKFGL